MRQELVQVRDNPAVDYELSLVFIAAHNVANNPESWGLD
jgi:hypothetical protein